MDGGRVVFSPCDDWECSELVSVSLVPSPTRDNFLFMMRQKVWLIAPPRKG